jgi:hypothetical protein
MRQVIGVGTPRGLQGRLGAILAALLTLIGSLGERAPRHSPARAARLTASATVDRRLPVVQIGAREMAFTTGC